MEISEIIRDLRQLAAPEGRSARWRVFVPMFTLRNTSCASLPVPVIRCSAEPLALAVDRHRVHEPEELMCKWHIILWY